MADIIPILAVGAMEGALLGYRVQNEITLLATQINKISGKLITPGLGFDEAGSL